MMIQKYFFTFTVFLLSLQPVSGQAAHGKWSKIFAFSGEQSPSGKFQEAVALSMDSGGDLYIVDRGLNRMVKYAASGRFIKEVGGYGDASEQFNSPLDIDAHQTLNIYLADYNNDRIVRFDQKLNYVSELRIDESSPYYFEMPLSVAVSAQYDLFILEDLNKRVIKIDRFLNPKIAFGGASDNLGQLLAPHQIALSEKGELFVGDPGQGAVVVFDYLGNFVRDIVHPDFKQPSGVAVSNRGTLVVADPDARALFFFDAAGGFREKFQPGQKDLQPVDAALIEGEKEGQDYLYLLSPKQCVIYRR